MKSPMLLSLVLTIAAVAADCLAATKIPPGIAAAAERLDRAKNTAGEHGGLLVHVGCGDGTLTAALRVDERYVIHGLDTDPLKVAAARTHLQESGLYGRVSVDLFDGVHLPYTDNLVNRLVLSGRTSVAREELLRVLAPGGVAVFAAENAGTVTGPIVKPWPATIDEWTHYLHGSDNNAVAQDSDVGPPRHLRWKAGPLYCRSHEFDPSVAGVVSSGGRLFSIIDEGPIGVVDPRLPSRWVICARDAFSGIELWKRRLPNWGWREWSPKWTNANWTRIKAARLQIPRTVPRRLVAVADRVYVTLGYRAPVSVLDATDGRLLRTLETTNATEELVLDGNVMVVSGLKGETGESPSRFVRAVQPDSGKVLWSRPIAKMAVQTLACAHGKVVFHTTSELVCLDRETGVPLWRVAGKAGNELRAAQNATVIHAEAVLFSGAQGLTAHDPDTGTVLWRRQRQRPLGGGPALYVIDEMVWYGGASQNFFARNTYRDLLPDGPVNTWVEKTGRDVRSGSAKRTVRVDNLFSCGHHYRCYRSKATQRFILWPKRGVEFFDVRGEVFDRCDWLRAPCRYGVLPCNGLLYVPPHQCFCYPAARLNGYMALSARVKPPGVATARLLKGPAFGADVSSSTHSHDWPTYRRDARRSGSTPTSVPSELKTRWTRTIGGGLTAAVVADGRLFVAARDLHAVYCLSADDGKSLWSYTTGGRVDSPPTVHNGRVLFGSADGWVYCLRADDGELMWRFRAARKERRIVVFEQVESAWPVHGSVLVVDNVAYVTAGRSSFLDGGITVYGLDVSTGRIIHQTTLEGPFPRIPEDNGRPHDMQGARSEVLVAEGNSIFLRQIEFNTELRQLPTPRITRIGDRGVGRHLFSTTSLLDPTWYNRGYWMYSKRWPGFYFAQAAPKTGQLIVFDDRRVYSAEMFNTPRHMFFPETHSVHIVADDVDNEPVLSDAAANWDKGPGFQRGKPAVWDVAVPVLVRAMVLAGNRLFAAGPPNDIPKDDPLAAIEGRRGARLCAYATVDGDLVFETPLPSPPVFDGMIAAAGRLFVSAEDGRLICLGE